MKVLHVITGLDAGGAEIQLSLILRYTRHDCDVVTLYNPGPVAEQIRAGGTWVRDLSMRRNTQLTILPRLRSIIARGYYDVVHTHLYRSQIYARLPFFQRNEIPKLHSHPFLISVFESLLLAGAKLRAGVCVR